ncbi:DUF6477 family protein [Methylocystis parvus]|uniref:DUF6477 family protein n=1 Tax=Methylocystis parvus TaxID=134 RepID=UPI003C795B2C
MPVTPNFSTPRRWPAEAGACERMKTRAFERLKAGARPALNAALDAGLAGYDRLDALSRFHRLSRDTILSETPEAARAVLREIERALRAERARGGHWTYDLNRHIALLVAHRAEKTRLARLVKPGA